MKVRRSLFLFRSQPQFLGRFAQQRFEAQIIGRAEIFGNAGSMVTLRGLVLVAQAMMRSGKEKVHPRSAIFALQLQVEIGLFPGQPRAYFLSELPAPELSACLIEPMPVLPHQWLTLHSPAPVKRRREPVFVLVVQQGLVLVPVNVQPGNGFAVGKFLIRGRAEIEDENEKSWRNEAVRPDGITDFGDTRFANGFVVPYTLLADWSTISLRMAPFSTSGLQNGWSVNKKESSQLYQK